MCYIHMNKVLIGIILALLLIITPSVLAKGKGSSGDGSRRGSGGGPGGSAVEIRQDEVEQEEAEQRIRIRNQEFEIRGFVSSVLGNTFVVSGQTVVVDTSQATRFRQRGILQPGNFVRVKGVVVNSQNIAREIRVIGVN